MNHRCNYTRAWEVEQGEITTGEPMRSVKTTVKLTSLRSENCRLSLAESIEYSVFNEQDLLKILVIQPRLTFIAIFA